MFVWKKNRHFALLRVVLHDFPVASVTKISIILQTSLTWRPAWPRLSLLTSSAELTRDLHDLAPSLALSVMRRTKGGRYAPTPLKKKHKNSSSVEPGTSQALPKIVLKARHHHVYRIMKTIPAFQGERPTILDSHSEISKDLIDQKARRKRCTKSLSPIFQCPTPSTGQI